MAQPRQKPKEQTTAMQSGCTAGLRGCATALSAAEDRFQESQEVVTRRSRLLHPTLNEPQPVNPELSTNGSSGRNARQLHTDELGAGWSYKAASGVFPEIRVSQVFAHEQRGGVVSVNDGELHRSRAIHVFRFVKRRKVISGVWFDRDHLGDTRIGESRSIQRDTQRP